MEAEIQQKFADMDRHFDELMVFLRDNMATKEDLANLETKVDFNLARLENKMDEGFSSLHSEIKSIKEKL